MFVLLFVLLFVFILLFFSGGQNSAVVLK